MRHFFVILGLLSTLTVTSALAQQEPLGTQYMYNPLAYNPSYAGLNNITNVTLNSRFQWSALEGSPTSYALAANTSIVDGKVGLGLLVINDQIGATDNTEVALSYAYKIGSATSSFSFGLQTGFDFYKSNTDELNLRVSDDPFFVPGTEQATTFNIGAGVSYMSEQLFVSLSVPKLFDTGIGGGAETIEIKQHFYLMGAYIVDLKPGFKMKPSVLLRGVPGTPLAYDINVNFLIGNHLRAGVFTRSFKTYGLMARFEFMEAYSIGYSFEMLTNNFAGMNLPTHEIMLSADFALFSHQDVYRRYF
jgi:type IX secretion system PorP/SprF family membrane protein